MSTSWISSLSGLSFVGFSCPCPGLKSFCSSSDLLKGLVCPDPGLACPGLELGSLGPK